MRFCFRISAAFALLFAVATAGAQQVIDPTTQIQWPLIAGAGTPTSLSIACSSVNYGQPFLDTATTLNTNYTCGTTGWQTSPGTGTITAVSPGNGLSGGGSAGAVTLSCAQASSSVAGCVEVDGTTIMAASGVISAVGGATFTPSAIQFATSTTLSRAATSADLVALFTGCSTGAPLLSFTGGCATATGISGLASDGNSGNPGITVQGSSEVGGYHTTFKCTGADPADGNGINAKLAATGAGTVVELTGGTCLDETVTIVGHSGQVLDGDRATTLILQPSAVPSPAYTGLLTNAAANETASRTCSDIATTLGSNIITSASGCQFAATDVGSTINLAGVLPALTEQGVSIPTAQAFTIRSQVSATEAVLTQPVPTTNTGITGSFYPRDDSFTLRGLTIVNNGPGCGSGVNDNWWATVFGNINHLLIQDVKFQNGTTGQTTGNGCKQVLFYNTAETRLIDNTCLTWSIYEDCYDVFANNEDGQIKGQMGASGDDGVAMQSTTNGFYSAFPFQGANVGWTIDGNTMASATAIVKMYGADQYGYLPNNNITVSHTKCLQAVPGTTSATNPFTQTGVLIASGTENNVTVDDMSGACAVDLKMSGAFVTHLIANNLQQDPTTEANHLVYIFGSSYATSPVYSDLAFTNIKYDGTAQATLIYGTDAGATINGLRVDGFSIPNMIYTTASAPPININATAINGPILFSRFAIPVASATANVPTVYLGPATGISTTIALGNITVSDSIFNTTAGTDGQFPVIHPENMSTSPLVTFRNNILTSATSSTNAAFFGSYTTGSPGTLGVSSFIFEGNVLSNVTGCINEINGSTAYLTGWSTATSFNNSYTSLGNSATCPPATQVGPETVAGAVTRIGAEAGYDKISLNGTTAPTVGTLTTASGVTGGSLSDSTAYYYVVCSTNSVGTHCSSEKTITTGSGTPANQSTITIPISTQGLGATSYTFGRGTTSGGELTCSSPLVGVAPYISTITDVGATCSGAALAPSSNTSYPTITLPNPTGTAVTVSGPAASGQLTTTAQLSSIRAGTWTISSATSVIVTFATAMSATPTTCTPTPTSSSATTGQPFPSSTSTTGFTVNVPVSGTISGTYLCAVNGSN
jgi:hypothetical protein